MTATSKRAAKVCRHKARYSTWAAAEVDGIRIWRTRAATANPATPYPCDHCDGFHLAQSPTVRRKARSRT